MVKNTMLRLPDAVGEELQKIAQKKGIPFATLAKEILCEHVAPVTACKHATDAASHRPIKESVPACQ